MGIPVIIVNSGIPVVPVPNGVPVSIAENGYGTGVTISTRGTPVTGLFVDETMALIARMTTAPTAQRSALIDTLIRSLKTAGVWTKLDALYLLAAADAQAARLNWVGSSYNPTPVASPTFTTDRGYAGDGASSYLDTNFNPATAGGKFAQNDAAFGIWSRSNIQAGSVAGWFDGSDGVTILPRSVVDVAQARINQATITPDVASTDARGFFVISRSDASAVRFGRNGSQIQTATTTSTPLNSATLRLGSITAASFATTQFAAAFIGKNITAPEEASLYTALNTYLTSIGAA